MLTEPERQPASTSHCTIFAYGSLMDAHEIQRGCPSSRSLGPARLPDYELTFPRVSKARNSLVASIAGRSGAEVWGVLWQVAIAELDALDAREGYKTNRAQANNSYQRVEVSVETGSGRSTSWTYVANPQQLKGTQLMSEEYHRLLVRGANVHGLPHVYVEKLKHLPRTVVF